MMKRLCFFLLCAVLVITASWGVAETSDIKPQDADKNGTFAEYVDVYSPLLSQNTRLPLVEPMLR